MKSVKIGKTNKVGKNTGMANTKTNKETYFKQVSAITNRIRSIGGIFTKIAKKVREFVKKHPKKSNAALVVLTHVACKKAKELDDKVQDKSKQAEKENKINWWKYSGLTIATSFLLAACSVDTDKQIELEQEKQKTSKSGIELEQERQKTIKAQKDFIKDLEQNCKENHGQFFIEKGGIKDSISIEVEAECKTPKPTKTNQTPIQPKHLPNSKQPHSQRGSKAQELIAYLQKELESLPYSQKAIAKQVNFYRPSSIAYLELDPRDFNVTEEWQNENLKIRSKAQAKMLEMRNPQANLSPFQSFSIIQNIVADINKEIEAAANTEKKAEKVGYGYSKRM
ncbi:DUF874 family protein [Helicobacter pylori]|uniref:DUF874 family protein n=1 Tax=Helicobacter pylori TaxID=210 RepID=UPI000174CA70|nr:DUF874 family protein [Helicobacter pylori]ACD47580.1 hypothetical protein HPSH_00600 [Helicobacter pylori Shi470]